MNQLDIEAQIVVEKDAEVPAYASQNAAGADVRAHLLEEIEILPGQSALIPTGLKMAIPAGYEVQVRPRSGLALKHQITVLNTPGTIDADYRGPIGVILINHGKTPFKVVPKMRIAQLILAPVCRASFVRAQTLDETERGGGGFGHTGVH